MCFIVDKQFMEKWKAKKDRPKVHTFYKAFCKAFSARFDDTYLYTPFYGFVIKQPGIIKAKGELDLVLEVGKYHSNNFSNINNPRLNWIEIHGGVCHAYTTYEEALIHFRYSKILPIQVRDDDIVSINETEVVMSQYEILKKDWDKFFKKNK